MNWPAVRAVRDTGDREEALAHKLLASFEGRPDKQVSYFAVKK
jgi:hypothetical protein